MAEFSSITELYNFFSFLGLKKNIFNTPNDNPKLKVLFSNASKNKSRNAGRPDGIYYNEKINLLIIFECKSRNLYNAVQEAKYYKNCILEKKLKSELQNIFDFINKV